MVKWNNTIQICVLVVSFLCTSTATMATVTEEGFYIGAELGQADADYEIVDIGKIFKFKPTDGFAPLIPPLKNSDIDAKGFAGRIFLGYNFFRFFGLELGGAYFPDADLNETVSGVKIELDGFAAAVDLSAKFMLPIMDRFGVFARIGGAYSLFRGKLKIRITPRVSSQETEGEFTVVWGAGATFAVTPSFVVGASWSHYDSSNQVRSVDMIGATISYHWVDSIKYCGEFLC